MKLLEEMLFYIRLNKGHDGIQFKLDAVEWLAFQEFRNEFGMKVVQLMGSVVITYDDCEDTCKKLIKIEKIKGL